MALKEDINDIKQSLSAEEEFLENVIKSEFFIKKHKKLIISIIVILVVICGGIYLSRFVQQKNTQEANNEFNKIPANSKFANIINHLRHFNGENK